MAKKETKPKTPKKSVKEGRAFIAKAPIRRLMRNEGAVLVSEKALSLLVNKLTELGTRVTKTALKIVKDDSRKRITKIDIEKAAMI